MIALLKKHPFKLAISLSLILHLLLLFGPKLVKLEPLKILPPLLIAHLEILPARKKPAAPPHTKPHTKLNNTQGVVVSGAEILPAPPAATDDIPSVASAVEAAPVAKTTQLIAAPAHPLPRHAQLTFIAYKGTNLRIGEVRHSLDIDEQNRYTLQVVMNTTGLASLLKTFTMNQQSNGKALAQGLQPDNFTQQKLTSQGTQNLSAKFDWQNKQLNFSAGDHVVLPDTAQDILSFLYQFSQLSLAKSTLNVAICNGKKLETYQLEVGEEVEIRTPLGKLRALPLRKIHASGEEGLEIWLGLEYRLLPVKIVQIDRSGEVAGELDIAEVRVSEQQD